MKKLFFISFVLTNLLGFGQNENPFTTIHGVRTTAKVNTPVPAHVIRYQGNDHQSLMQAPLHEVKDEMWQVDRDPENGQINRIYGFHRKKSYTSPAELQTALTQISGGVSTFQIQSPVTDVFLHKNEKTSYYTSVWSAKGNQYIQGIPVYGGQFTVSGKLDPELKYIPGLLLGRVLTYTESQPLHAGISLADARNIAQTEAAKLSKEWIVLSGLPLELMGGDQCKIELMMYPVNQQLTLSYICTVRPNTHNIYKIVLNANNGQFIEYWEESCHANGPTTTSGNDLNGVNRTVNNYEHNGRFYMINASESMYNSSSSVMPDNPKGTIWTIDAQNTDGSSVVQISRTSNSGWNATTISAQYNAKVCYDYYKNKHGRNSINGSGGNIISVINVTQNGSAMDNAYWNGTAMWYGNGKNAFKPLAGSLDVAGHEMTHGVVENTANLEYKNQSGALNESFADIFGAMIEGVNWKIGESVVRTAYYPSGALRDMADPHNGGSSLSDPGYQPKKMREIYTGTQDNGGVHINSGIPNHAYYLLATAITKAKAEQIYYRTLSLYLTATSKFLDLRFAAVKAAGDLYGASGTEVSEVKKAFDAVEIFDPGGSSSTPQAGDLNVNPGQDYIISYDVNYAGLSTRWFRSSTTATNFLGLSTTKSKAPMSLPDNGAKGYYIGKDSRMYSVTTGSSPVENIVQSQTIWDNVAVSKDGKMIAAVTTSVDSSIWMYDGNQWNQFILYNPTTASGVNSGGVLYAGALEWSYNGEYVMYDALNVIKNSGGSNIYYWDVGVLRVWDLKKNALGDGKVSKLFNNLPSGISIGNPSYSKNSPYILAFDYINSNNSTYAVLAANFNTNTTKTIFTNTTLSWPNYSKNDDKLIFTSDDALGDTHVWVMPLKSDKMSSNGNATKLISDAKWGTWYSTGTRKLLDAEKKILSFSFPGLTPAVQCTISGTNITGSLPAGTDASNLIPTFTYSPLASITVNGTDQISGASPQDFSSPVDYVVRAQDGTTQTYTVTLTLPKSSAKDITSFVFNGLTPAVVANISGTQITAMVPNGTNVTNLVAWFTLSPKATLKKGSVTQTTAVTANDYTFPITFTVVAEDGSTKDYTVTVAKGSGGAGKDFLSFGFTNPTVAASINGISIVANVPSNTNVSSLVATFTVSSGATVFVGSTQQTSGQNVNNFTQPVTYTVKGQDNTTRDYVVSVFKTTPTDVINKSTIQLYPNPTQDLVNLSGQVFRYEIYTMQGQQVYQSGITSGTVVHNMSLLPAGIYIFKIVQDGVTENVKVIYQPSH